MARSASSPAYSKPSTSCFHTNVLPQIEFNSLQCLLKFRAPRLRFRAVLASVSASTIIAPSTNGKIDAQFFPRCSIVSALKEEAVYELATISWCCKLNAAITRQLGAPAKSHLCLGEIRAPGKVRNLIEAAFKVLQTPTFAFSTTSGHGRWQTFVPINISPGSVAFPDCVSPRTSLCVSAFNMSISKPTCQVPNHSDWNRAFALPNKIFDDPGSGLTGSARACSRR